MSSGKNRDSYLVGALHLQFPAQHSMPIFSFISVRQPLLNPRSSSTSRFSTWAPSSSPPPPPPLPSELPPAFAGIPTSGGWEQPARAKTDTSPFRSCSCFGAFARVWSQVRTNIYILLGVWWLVRDGAGFARDGIELSRNFLITCSTTILPMHGPVSFHPLESYEV